MNISETSKENVKKVLKQIDIALATRGILGHQERMMRIYKTVMAVEKHSNCFVSKFLGDGENETPQYMRTFEEVNKPSVNLLTDPKTKKLEFEFEDDDPLKKNFKVSIDELLTYVEGELGLTQISDSSDGGVDTDCSNHINKEKKRKKELEKKFNNIELKLRAFIKENETYDIFSESAFKNFIEDQRLKTPGSNKSKNKEQTTKISYNFFKEKEVIDVCQKRYSYNPDQLKDSLNNFAIKRTDSKFATYSQFKDCIPNSAGKEVENLKPTHVSKFCPYMEDLEGKEEEKISPKKSHEHTFSIEKRGSIFKNRVFRKETFEFIGITEKESDDDLEQSDISFVSIENSPIKSPRKKESDKKKVVNFYFSNENNA